MLKKLNLFSRKQKEEVTTNVYAPTLAYIVYNTKKVEYLLSRFEDLEMLESKYEGVIVIDDGMQDISEFVEELRVDLTTLENTLVAKEDRYWAKFHNTEMFRFIDMQAKCVHESDIITGEDARSVLGIIRKTFEVSIQRAKQ